MGELHGENFGTTPVGILRRHFHWSSWKIFFKNALKKFHKKQQNEHLNAGLEKFPDEFGIIIRHYKKFHDNFQKEFSLIISVRMFFGNYHKIYQECLRISQEIPSKRIFWYKFSEVFLGKFKKKTKPNAKQIFWKISHVLEVVLDSLRKFYKNLNFNRSFHRNILHSSCRNTWRSSWRNSRRNAWRNFKWKFQKDSHMNPLRKSWGHSKSNSLRKFHAIQKLLNLTLRFLKIQRKSWRNFQMNSWRNSWDKKNPHSEAYDCRR